MRLMTFFKKNSVHLNIFDERKTNNVSVSEGMLDLCFVF